MLVLCENVRIPLFNPLLRIQSSNVQEQQRLEENLQSQWRESELVIQKRNLAGKLQHYLTVSQIRYELDWEM